MCRILDTYPYMPMIVHMAKKTSTAQVIELARERGVITYQDVRERGIHSQVLTRLTRQGLLERVAHGRYRLVSYPMTEHHGLVLAASAVPKCVICLLSALQFHGIGSQLPHHVWIALDRKAWRPELDYPPLQIVCFSGEALTSGIEEHTLEGQKVRIYGVAKTLADCFKYRNKIGLEVALEALNEAWRDQRFQLSEVEHYAHICRVWNVMRPYLEAIVT